MGAFDRDGKAAIVRRTDRSKYQTLAQIDQQGVRVVVNPDGTNADFDKANIHHATIVNYPDNNTSFGQTVTQKGGRGDHGCQRDPVADEAEPATLRGEHRPPLHHRAEGISASPERSGHAVVGQQVAEHRAERRHVRSHQPEMDGPGDLRVSTPRRTRVPKARWFWLSPSPIGTTSITMDGKGNL
jgi:hypothetical protein